MEDESDETPLRGWRSRWANRSYATSEIASDIQLPSQFGSGAVGPFLESDLFALNASYSPSIDPGAATIDVGGGSSHMDDSTALSHAFIDRHKPFLWKMPWENSIMEPIFRGSIGSAVVGHALIVGRRYFTACACNRTTGKTQDESYRH